MKYEVGEILLRIFLIDIVKITFNDIITLVKREKGEKLCIN